jgi:hypothetical protein
LALAGLAPPRRRLPLLPGGLTVLHLLNTGGWLYVSEGSLRHMSRKLRALTDTAAAGLADPAEVRALAREVAIARHTYTESGVWDSRNRPSVRRSRRTMEDAKQTVRRAEIVLAALRKEAQ